VLTALSALFYNDRCVGLARTIYIQFIYGIFGRESPNIRSYTVCIYTVLFNNDRCVPGAVSLCNQCSEFVYLCSEFVYLCSEFLYLCSEFVYQCSEFVYQCSEFCVPVQ
jgi:hypothetical protein